jgi:hypothetical protein
VSSRVARWLEAENVANDLRPRGWEATGGPGQAEFLRDTGAVHAWNKDKYGGITFVPGDAIELARWILANLTEADGAWRESCDRKEWSKFCDALGPFCPQCGEMWHQTACGATHVAIHATRGVAP